MKVSTLCLMSCLLPAVFILSMTGRHGVPARRLKKIGTTTTSHQNNNREAAGEDAGGIRKVKVITVKRRVIKLSAANNSGNKADNILNKKEINKKGGGSVKRFSKLKRKKPQESGKRQDSRMKKFRIKLKTRTKHQDISLPTADAKPDTADIIPDITGIIPDTTDTKPDSENIPYKAPALYLTERRIFSPANTGGRRYMK